MDWPRYYIASLMSHMGFLATELGSLGHVCFPPDSDRIADIAGGPVGARALNRCAIARCAGSPTARTVAGVKIGDGARVALS